MEKGWRLRRVLLLDNNDVFRAALSAELREHGCEVEEAADLETGIEKVNQGSFDTVFVDCFMPDCFGDEVTKSIIAEHPEVEVIVITRSPHADIVERALDFGAKRVLPKPVTV